MAKVEAYSKTTGEKQIIPGHWLDSKNPSLDHFRKTPLTPVPAAAETSHRTENKKKES